MNEELVQTLTQLRHDSSVAVDLYRQLFQGHYWALVQRADVPIQAMSFLTYATKDHIQELPVFTSQELPLLSRLESQGKSIRTYMTGPNLWSRMLDIVKTGQCEVAVDPGEKHGIRLTAEMVLGMISKYGSKTPDK